MSPLGDANGSAPHLFVWNCAQLTTTKSGLTLILTLKPHNETLHFQR